MPSRTLPGWMWSDAVGMLARAERLARQGFEPLWENRQRAGWEPPADVVETRDEVLVFVALPGVDGDAVQVTIEGGALVISGERVLPPALRTAIIHRLELPQGRFSRRIPLPAGVYHSVHRTSSCGCVTVVLRKADERREIGL